MLRAMRCKPPSKNLIYYSTHKHSQTSNSLELTIHLCMDFRHLPAAYICSLSESLSLSRSLFHSSKSLLFSCSFRLIEFYMQKETLLKYEWKWIQNGIRSCLFYFHIKWHTEDSVCAKWLSEGRKKISATKPTHCALGFTCPLWFSLHDCILWAVKVL